MVVDLGKHTCSCRFWQLTDGSVQEDLLFQCQSSERTGFVGKTPYPAPVPPPFKAKPGRPTKKRKRDKDEQPTGLKTKMKRKYNPIRCMYCGEIGHNKRSCANKKSTEAEEHARQLKLQLAVVAPAADGVEPEVNSVPDEHNPAPTVIDISQSESIPPTQDTQQLGLPSYRSLKGKPDLGSATAKKLANSMTFVPTPGFKPPRKTDK
ncbi:hypothetical protein Ahy_B10g101347 [Arachis hypogaea]|uniref:CCHC-type domain-containing protein n=1 Tax=Arachis hypogaea TaxID=3818 RepID=A0A444WZG0_ARAHY|nr:hypothetical protein Ahy_B10g101347 [Arachis hypogaea]